jgi:hypothetical protein
MRTISAAEWITSRSALVWATVSCASTCGAKPEKAIEQAARSANVAQAMRDLFIWRMLTFGLSPVPSRWDQHLNGYDDQRVPLMAAILGLMARERLLV